MIGKTLGKYRVIGHLGTGGMSEVYKAYQPGLDRYVAIKVLHTFLATEKDFLTRFQREAKFAAMLRHPNIVRVHDFDTENNAYYMVMEFVEGPSLKTRLQEIAKQGQLLPLEEVVRIVSAVANALDYAHSRGTVHRDIKPANIMFTHDEEVILMDFGIAKMVDVVGLTASGAMVGTPAYMAPEQGMGQAGDERADIYSLGVVLYQLATGRLPFDAETPMGVVLKHINEPLPPPTTVAPNLSPGIEAVIEHALTKSPEDRYQTAKELAADLKRAMAGQPVEQITPEPATTSGAFATSVAARAPGQAKRWERATLPSAPAYPTPTDYSDRPKRRWGAWLAALLALILIGGGGALYATGRADPLLIALASLVPPVATSTSDAKVTPTSTPDEFATQVAA
ncbi:MAG: serine/threonine-protein kinase, partial [Chloroflexota bacterium]|nr:serine/threonine-protein kinase [Chloroflexota bacterium]